MQIGTEEMDVGSVLSRTWTDLIDLFPRYVLEICIFIYVINSCWLNVLKLI